jgi:AraC-like DNA-binding protein
MILKFPKGIFKYFLIFLLLTFFFSNVQLLFRNLGNVNFYFYFTIWPSILFSATPLVVFLFFIYLMKGKYTFHLFHLPLFIPILMGVLNFLYFHFFLSRPEQLSNISDFIAKGWDKEVFIGYFRVALIRIIRHSIGFISGLYLLKIYNNFKNINKEDINKKKINNFYFYFLSSWVIINLFYLIIGFIELENIYLHTSFIFFSVIISFLFFIFLALYPSIMIGYPLLARGTFNEAFLLDNRIKSIDPLVIEQKLTHWENTSNSYLSTNFTIKDLIKETGLESDFILFHLTSIKGLNYEHYITNLRISYAIKLLEEGFLENNSITKLAENSGFKNVKTFNNTFFAIMNCFPENYKNNGRE